MNGQICMRYEYFILFILVTVAIIIFVLYQINNQYRQMTLITTHKLKNIYDGLTDMVKDKKEEQPEQQLEQPEQPVISTEARLSSTFRTLSSHCLEQGL